MQAAASDCVTWMGRTRVSPDGSVTLGFPGITLLARFRGTLLALELSANSPDCYFAVSIDGNPSTIARAEKGRHELILCDGLATGEHLLRLVRRNESWQGVAEIHSIITDGELLPPPALPSRKLLFIGDSVTCGAAAERLPPDYSDETISCNAEASYAMQLAGRLDAQVHLVSYGGRGVLRDYQGFTSDKIANGPVIFERTLPDDAHPAWDHATWQPDSIVVELGTNDFNQGIPDEQVWVEAYVSFAGRIREVHPHAWIFLANSPMFSPRVDNGDAAKAAAINHYLDETIARRLAAGDRRIEKAAFRYQPGTPTNAHPIAPQHLLMADDLEPLLRSRLAWR